MDSRAPIESCIVTVRGQRAILASDLARTYGVETRVLNQAVRRNRERFPADFMFQLTREEADTIQRSRSQSVTLKRGQNVKYAPLAFTEHGALMVASVLGSPRAQQMSIFVVRAFVRMRGMLTETRDLARKLADLERELKGRLDVHEAAIVGVLQQIMAILDPPAVEDPPRRQIGFESEPCGSPDPPRSCS